MKQEKAVTPGLEEGARRNPAVVPERVKRFVAIAEKLKVYGERSHYGVRHPLGDGGETSQPGRTAAAQAR